MRLVTTLNPVCAKVYSRKLKLEERVVHPVSGQHVRHKCSPNNIKQKAADTETNNEETAEVTESLDKAKVAYEKWQAEYPRAEGNWGKVLAIKSYQSIVAPRICGNYEEEA